MGRLSRFIALATKAALQSQMEFKHGAVLVKGGSLVSKGFNGGRTTLMGKAIPSLHAEISCLHNRSKNSVKGSDLYIVRLSSSGLAASKPCQGCLETLREFGVKNVYYSTRDGIEVVRISEDAEGYYRPFAGQVHKEYYQGPVLYPVPN